MDSLRTWRVGLALLAAMSGCASTRPVGAGRDPMVVEEHGKSWDAKLGDASLSHAEAFRAADFTDVADHIDSRRSYAWGGLGVGAGMALATAGLGYGFSQSHNGAFVVGGSLTATWALSALIVAAVNFGASDPPASDGKAAADSYDARLALTAAGLAFRPPEPSDAPSARAEDDRWLLAYSRAQALERAHLGLTGLHVGGRTARLGLQVPALVREIDAAFAAAGNAAILERARFALDRADATVLEATRLALSRYALEANDELVWIALGDVHRARQDGVQAIAAYAKALGLAPLSMASLRAYGRELTRTGHTHDAIETWAQAIPKISGDAARFELLDAIDHVDRAWIYANGARLPPGLAQAYADHVAELRRQERLSNCLDACYRVEWESLRHACEADCNLAQ